MQGAIIEPLESRTLYSAAISGELTGTLPQTLLPAAADHLTVTITNTGDARAKGSVAVNLYLSSSPAITGDSILVGIAHKHLGINPGRGTNVNVKFKLPSGVADGQYFLAANLFSAGVLSTTGSTTQQVVDASAITVQQPTESLAGAFASSPITVGLDTSGDAGSGTVKLRVINPTPAVIHGTIAANLYLSDSIQLDDAAQWVGSLTGSRLTIAPGRSKVVRRQVTIPSITRFGTYHLLAVLKNTPTGGPNTAVFARQPITIDQGADTSTDQDTGDTGDTGGIDTTDDGFDDGATIDDGQNAAPPPATTTAPTTEDDGGTDTQPSPPDTQPSGSDDDGSNDGDDGGTDNSGGDAGSTDSSGDDGGDNSGSDDNGDYSGDDLSGGGDDMQYAVLHATPPKPPGVAVTTPQAAPEFPATPKK